MECIRTGEKIKGLEYKTDLTISDLRQLVVIHCMNVIPI